MMRLFHSIRLMMNAHIGQTDKAGCPYFTHPLRVMSGLLHDTPRAPEFALMAAVLHDVLEDSNVTLGDLEKCGLPRRTIDIVRLLTKTEAEDYPAYIQRIADSSSYWAVAIKIADLSDNLDPWRMDRIECPLTKSRLQQKYSRALVVLGRAL